MAAGNSDEEGREEGGMGEKRKGRETQITTNVLFGFPALGRRRTMTGPISIC